MGCRRQVSCDYTMGYGLDGIDSQRFVSEIYVWSRNNAGLLHLIKISVWNAIIGLHSVSPSPGSDVSRLFAQITQAKWNRAPWLMRTQKQRVCARTVYKLRLRTYAAARRWRERNIDDSNAVILNPSFWLVLSRFLLTITMPYGQCVVRV